MATITAMDFKDPPKVLVGGADGIYTGVTKKFNRGPLKGMSRALKATQHDAGVVLYGED